MVVVIRLVLLVICPKIKRASFKRPECEQELRTQTQEASVRS